MSSQPSELDDLENIEDLGDVLALLNQRTRFRYTGLYLVEPPTLRNLRLHDRENPHIALAGGICPLDDTYCSIVEATARPFVTHDARHDASLSDHPARFRVLSYAGVPVHLPGGEHGTLCHFDARPRLLPPTELRYLEAAVPILAKFLRPLAPAPAARRTR